MVANGSGKSGIAGGPQGDPRGQGLQPGHARRTPPARPRRSSTSRRAPRPRPRRWRRSLGLPADVGPGRCPPSRPSTPAVRWCWWSSARTRPEPSVARRPRLPEAFAPFLADPTTAGRVHRLRRHARADRRRARGRPPSRRQRGGARGPRRSPGPRRGDLGATGRLPRAGSSGASPVVLSGLYGLQRVEGGERHDDAAGRCVAGGRRRRGGGAGRPGPRACGSSTRTSRSRSTTASTPRSPTPCASWATVQAIRSGLELRSARMSVELHPPVDADKGTALLDLAGGPASGVLPRRRRRGPAGLRGARPAGGRRVRDGQGGGALARSSTPALLGGGRRGRRRARGRPSACCDARCGCGLGRLACRCSRRRRAGRPASRPGCGPRPGGGAPPPRSGARSGGAARASARASAVPLTS